MTTDCIDRFRRQVETVLEDLDQDDIALIPTTKGLTAIIDKKHEAAVKSYRWHVSKTGRENIYAVTNMNGRKVSLQRIIRMLGDESLSLAETKYITFANKCSLDCREANLVSRADRTSVMRNRRPRQDASSQFKGVRKAKKSTRGERWSAWIQFEKDDVLNLGTYENEKDAAAAYDAASFLFFEGSGFLNFPDEPPTAEAIEAVTLSYARYKHRRARKKQKSD